MNAPDHLLVANVKRRPVPQDLYEALGTRFGERCSRVQAVREADGRGARVAPEHVRLDAPLNKGWIPDRRVYYKIADLSRDGWVITLAYGEPQ